MSDNFTPEQDRAINFNDGSLTVSASAGSGKTRVLISRLIRLMTECDSGADAVSVKDVLAVTFTRLAATEIRDKLRRAFIETLEKTTEELKNAQNDDERAKLFKKAERIKKQIESLPLASISTIDSFYNGLIKKYYYLVGIDPQFSIVAEAECNALKNNAIAEVFEKLYDDNDEDIKKLLKVFLSKRNDSALRKNVLEIYTFIESEEDGFAFLEKALENYSEEGLKKVENALIAQLFVEMKDAFDKIDGLIQRAAELGALKYYNYLTAYRERYQYFCKNRTVEAVQSVLGRYDKPKIEKSDTPEINALSDEIVVFKEKFKGARDNVKKYFPASETYEDRLKHTLEAGELLKALIKVVKLFDTEFTAEKRERNVLDYADLSHLTYRLLSIDEVARDVKNTYKYIFVDEYQDTNGIQEAIFRRIESNNIFIVGDEKQSIYAFRGCDSSIFTKRKEESGMVDAHIELNKNFRSAVAVLDAVNKTFSAVMTKDTCDVDYARSKMVYGEGFKEYKGEAKLCYLADSDTGSSASALGVYSIKKHLEFEAEKIVGVETVVAYLVNRAKEGTIFDRDIKKERCVQDGDICVITRKNSGVADRIVDELTRAGIPVVSQSHRSIGEYPEIKTLVNILQCVYYDSQDVALAVTLKSPIANFTDLDLKKVRDGCADKKIPFTEAAKLVAKGDSLLAERLRKFFTYIDRIRLLAEFEGVPTLLRRIIRENGFEAHYAAERGGSLKLQRIERFIAEGYSGSRELSIGEYLGSLDTMLEKMTISASGGENAVKVMTMHASKGLEFPVVIIAELYSNWNNQDTRAEIVMDRKAGIGLNYYDFDTKKKAPTIIKNYVKTAKFKSNLRDEMRLLYVAMTRAQSKLYVVAKKEPNDKHEGNLLSLNNQLDFLAKEDFDYEALDYEKVKNFSAHSDESDATSYKSDENCEKTLKKYFDFNYAYGSDTTLSLKRTVTEIAKSTAEIGDEPYAFKPVFASSDIDKGNAYHKFLQYCDFEKTADNALIALLNKNLLTQDEIKLIDTEQLNAILALKVFKDIKDYKLYREQPFIVSIKPEECGEEGSEDLLLQGVIDLLAIKAGKAVIVDYKHSGADKETLVERYHKQLKLYKYAVEKSLGLKVERLVLVNLLKLYEAEIDA